MATHSIIPSSVLDFLKALQANNQRDWFLAHKDVFDRQYSYVVDFAEALWSDLQQHDAIDTPSGKKALHRIYRDVRFSADKRPYKFYMGGGFTRATASRRGGYYFQIAPGNSFIGGCFWAPNKDDLRRIREDIAFDHTVLRSILESPTFKNTFGTLQGEQLKKMPKGYDENHEAIDLLRYKQFLVLRKFSDEEVAHKDFLKEACLTFRNLRPFFDYMSEVLSTDANGMS